MAYLMNLNNFKKVIAIGTVLTIVACFFPEFAQAGTLLKRSGWSRNSSTLSFDLDTSVRDRDRSDRKGDFPKAIQNFSITGSFNNSSVCGKDPCPPANVKVSKLKIDSKGNVVGLKVSDGKPISLEGLQKIFNDPDTGNSDIDFSKDVIRYDISFVGTSSKPELILFIQSNDSKLINDLSGLSQFDQIQGMFPRDVNVDDTGVNNGGIFTISEPSPEPTPTASPELTPTASPEPTPTATP